jgi:hypothetical protein
MNWNEWFYYDETSKSCLRWKVDVKSGRNYCITKIKAGDEAGTLDTNKHWQVKLNRKLRIVHHIIWEMFYGVLPDGYVIDHEDRDSTNNRVSNYRPIEQIYNTRNRNPNKNNTSGVHGVNFTTIKGSPYWMAQWRSLDGKNKIKSFSLKKLGYDEAFRLACEYRAKMIAELNEQGAGYTERHGT